MVENIEKTQYCHWHTIGRIKQISEYSYILSVPSKHTADKITYRELILWMALHDYTLEKDIVYRFFLNKGNKESIVYSGKEEINRMIEHFRNIGCLIEGIADTEAESFIKVVEQSNYAPLNFKQSLTCFKASLGSSMPLAKRTLMFFFFYKYHIIHIIRNYRIRKALNQSTKGKDLLKFFSKNPKSQQHSIEQCMIYFLMQPKE